MQRAPSADIDAFRRTIADFIAQHWQQAGQQPEHWRTALRERAWTVPHWPQALGGCNWNELQYFHWQQQCIQAGAPLGDHLSVNGVGPLLAQQPPSALQQQCLAGISDWSERWCLASPDPLWPAAEPLVLRPAAGGWRLSGQVQPVIAGLEAHWAMCLAQHQDSDSHTLVAVSLQQAAVRREPLPSVDEVVAGQASALALLASLDFADVQIPEAALIGGIGTGDWGVQFLRPFVAALDPQLLSSAALTSELADLRTLGTEQRESPEFQRTLAELSIELGALEVLEQRLLSGSADPQRGSLELMRRQRAWRLRSRIGDAQVAELGYYLLPYQPQELGDNEGPIGPAMAREKVVALLRSRGLLASFESWELGHSELAQALGLVDEPGA